MASVDWEVGGEDGGGEAVSGLKGFVEKGPFHIHMCKYGFDLSGRLDAVDQDVAVASVRQPQGVGKHSGGVNDVQVVGGGGGQRSEAMGHPRHVGLIVVAHQRQSGDPPFVGQQSNQRVERFNGEGASKVPKVA